MVTGIKVSECQFKAAGQTACDPCIICMAKQHKISRPSSSSDSSQPLELLHMGVCGPLEVQSLSGSRYLSTYLDGFSILAVIGSTGPQVRCASYHDACHSLLEAAVRAQPGQGPL